jgi:hypothetical protein
MTVNDVGVIAVLGGFTHRPMNRSSKWSMTNCHVGIAPELFATLVLGIPQFKLLTRYTHMWTMLGHGFHSPGHTQRTAIAWSIDLAKNNVKKQFDIIYLTFREATFDKIIDVVTPQHQPVNRRCEIGSLAS